MLSFQEIDRNYKYVCQKLALHLVWFGVCLSEIASTKQKMEKYLNPLPA
jgi:hypothetical protein